MHILAADDERMMLNMLVKSIEQAIPDAQVHAFERPVELLKFAGTFNCDVAFLDVKMGGMTGLELAKALKDMNPDINVIFVTGYTEYGVDAIQLHASGYIMKPVSPEKIIREMAELRRPLMPRPDAVLRVQCFGYFEVFKGNEPVIFPRKYAKELLAYLVDRKGGACTSNEIITALWDGEGDILKHKSHLRTITVELKRTLDSIGAGNVLIRAHGQWAIRKDLIDCDYYRMMQGDVTATNAYHSEYMAQYSWAEITAASLENI